MKSKAETESKAESENRPADIGATSASQTHLEFTAEQAADAFRQMGTEDLVVMNTFIEGILKERPDFKPPKTITVARDALGKIIDDVEMTLRLFRNLPKDFSSNQTTASLADVLGPLNELRKEVDKVEKVVKVILKSIAAADMQKAKDENTGLTLEGENYIVDMTFPTMERFSKDKFIAANSQEVYDSYKEIIEVDGKINVRRK